MASFTDTFDRADGVLGAGWSDVTGEGTFVIATNAAVPNNPGQDCIAVRTGEAYTNDQSSKANLATLAAAGTGEGIALVARGSAAAMTCYRAAINHAAASNIEIARFNAGVFAALTGGVKTQAWVDADEWELVVTGTVGAIVVVLKRNGAQVGTTVNDTSGSGVASGSPGIAYSSTGASDQVLSWTGSDVGAASSPSYIPRRRRLRYPGLTIR